MKRQFFQFLIPAAVLLIFTQNVSALDMEITGKEIEAYYKNEYNRVFNYYGELSAIGSMELNNRYAFKSGFLLGLAEDITDIKLFTSAGINPFDEMPLRFYLTWNYNGLPEYEAHAHTIQPVVSYNTDRAGVALGVSFRFSSFFGETAIFETILSLSCYFNFINNESLRIGITGTNFNDFFAGNAGDYFISLNSAVKINESWSLINDIELIQSGSMALSTNFYGVAWRAGAKFKW